MPAPSDFPHLRITYSGSFNATFGGGRETPEEVKNAKLNRVAHSDGLFAQIGEMQQKHADEVKKRSEIGLPDLNGKGFLLQVPEGSDVDGLAHTLGIDLIAETEKGFMFAGSEDLDFSRLEEVLAKFKTDQVGGGSAAQIVGIFYDKDDRNKLEEILKGDLINEWPFGQDTIYTFDVGIQTTGSTKSFGWTKLPSKKKSQTAEEHAEIVSQIKLEDRIRAEEMWMEAADDRFGELERFIRFYNGVIVDGYKSAELSHSPQKITFPDSIEVRIRMTGLGFRDLVENFRGVFDLSVPPDVRFLPGSPELSGYDADFQLLSPDAAAPKVCVIDSGIQEEHKWLEPAIDKASSRCFLPDHEEDDVSDHCSPRGHGTRVAGAVLYPRNIPLEGEISPVAWIQNARVLDSDNQLPLSLPPERYLTDVVDHFGGGESGTKIYNHSISDFKPCEGGRMCSWAAKIDDLSNKNDVLFIQIAGNVAPEDLFVQLSKGVEHPSQLLAELSKVASPGQSMHALTVGSVAHSVVEEDDRRSFARHLGHPSAFTRTGYSPLWKIVKPEVVEYGGDNFHEIPVSRVMVTTPAVATELVASTRFGSPAISSDDVGTSFAAPRVAHIAAHLQALFPNASAQLYRALIVQSARWPEWAENSAADEVLQLIGYGIPSLERASSNEPGRVTLITQEARLIWSKQYHLYTIQIPDDIRRASLEARVRIDVTLAYTSSPRRTRSRRNGYLETWLDWRTNNLGEPVAKFRDRMEGVKGRGYTALPWTIHHESQYGEVDVNRNQGSVQKDWAVVECNQLPEEFAVAVRAHVGWNAREGGGLARYCLVVSFEALDAELPVYNAIRNQVEVDQEFEAESGL